MQIWRVKRRKEAMKGNKIIEISADDIIIGIIDNGDVVAVLKKTIRGDLYYEGQKGCNSACIFASFRDKIRKHEITNRKQNDVFTYKLKVRYQKHGVLQNRVSKTSLLLTNCYFGYNRESLIIK